MKKVQVFIFTLLLLAGCGKTGDSLKKEKGPIIVDVTQKYEDRVMLSISINIDSVEYIPLEITDEFLCSGNGNIVAFTDDLIIYSNPEYQGGDILIFDSTGKGIKKLNRKGSSGEEYAYMSGVVYDDKSEELFVNDEILGKIFVYDLDGKYKRSFKHLDGIRYDQVSLFDGELLLCSTLNETVQYPIFLISRQTGEKIRDVVIPVKERYSTVYRTQQKDDVIHNSTIPVKMIRDIGKYFILSDPSSDTIYSMDQNKILTPLIVRTPPVSAMNPQTLLLGEAEIGDYFFMKSYNMGNFSEWGEPVSVGLAYNYRENKTFKYTGVMIRFWQYQKGKQPEPIDDISNIAYNSLFSFFIKKNTVIVPVKADMLKMEKENNYSDKYQAIVSKLKEDDNPVLVKIKMKEDSEF